MSKELDLFNEDVNEQLTFMENSLVNMQENGVNEDDIGALFRSMHTIKGTAGMFGFTDVVKFAHIAENLLSEVREKKVELTENMMETFLLCKDHTETLINIALNDGSLDEETTEINDALLTSLISFMPSNKQQELQKTNSVKEDSNNETATEEKWHISVKLNEDFFNTGMDFLNMLGFLKHLGTITKIVPITSSLPNIDNIVPTQSYLQFELQLFGETTYEDIEEVFEFVLDDITLNIFKTDDIRALKELTDNNEELKEFFISNDFFKQEQFNSTQIKNEETVKKQKNTEKVVTKSSKNFSLRVDSSKVDSLINQISEMVIANAKISQRADQLDDTFLSESATILSDMLEEVRSSVMNIRMVQVGDTFSKFKRIVHDSTKKLGKEINFNIVGEDTELDKMVVEKISDPLMHMLRNSVDHGIEMPQERIDKNKSAQGNITLKTYPDAGTIVIKITDDGKGLDKDAIITKAVTNGIIEENHNLTDKEIFNLIFEAGLSTAKEVSDISGRGVGMDVVRRNIEDLRGTIEIDSKKDEGSTFTIRLPLTLAIIDGFLIQSGKTKYIIPLEMIQECIELDVKHKSAMHGNQFINLRDSILPLLDIRDYFKEDISQTIRENVVVVKYGDYKMGMLVDELYGEFQTVIKPIGEVFKNVPGISGGTILGSGEIALIFDVPKLVEFKIKKV